MRRKLRFMSWLKIIYRIRRSRHSVYFNLAVDESHTEKEELVVLG